MGTSSQTRLTLDGLFTTNPKICRSSSLSRPLQRWGKNEHTLLKKLSNVNKWLANWLLETCVPNYWRGIPNWSADPRLLMVERVDIAFSIAKWSISSYLVPSHPHKRKWIPYSIFSHFSPSNYFPFQHHTSSKLTLFTQHACSLSCSLSHWILLSSQKLGEEADYQVLCFVPSLT